MGIRKDTSHGSASRKHTAIHHVWWDPNGGFGNDQWSGPNVGPQRPPQVAAGDPATMVTGQVQHTFYRADNGAIHHVWWDPNGGFGNDQWSGPNVGPQRPPQVAAGDPATMVTGQVQHTFYRGTDGVIYHVWWDLNLFP